jgi:hypothetical protein
LPIELTSSGDFSNTERFLNAVGKLDLKSVLSSYGAQGVDALARATPEDTGLTAQLWAYEVTQSGNSWTITWTNSHIVEGVSIAILIQYGHGTGTGGYVQGRDYINPAIKPIFDEIASGAWKAVTGN